MKEMFDTINLKIEVELMKDIADELQKRIDKAIEYMKYNATSNYFDKDRNMFRREIDLLNILQNGSDDK